MTTKAQGLKKHVTQMDELEKDSLMRRFNKIDKTDWTFTPYSQERFNERKIRPEHFLSLWVRSELIEYHKHNGSHRILLRSSRDMNNKDVCCVFDLTNKKIVTVWVNWKFNNHDNLLLGAYDKNIDIFEELRGL